MRYTKLLPRKRRMKEKHIHKRCRGYQFCKCGEYMGMPVEYVSLKDIIKSKFSVYEPNL